jgi:DNA-binding MarR family transcriptional regulator
MRVLARLAELGFGDTRMSHGYVVQGLLAGDRTVTDLAERLGISVQAVSKTVREM